MFSVRLWYSQRGYSWYKYMSIYLYNLYLSISVLLDPQMHTYRQLYTQSLNRSWDSVSHWLSWLWGPKSATIYYLQPGKAEKLGFSPNQVSQGGRWLSHESTLFPTSGPLGPSTGWMMSILFVRTLFLFMHMNVNLCIKDCCRHTRKGAHGPFWSPLAESSQHTQKESL